MESESFLSQRGDVIIILESICPAAQLSCASLVPIKPMIKQSVTCIRL